jgi:hypothetical protein
MEASAFVIPQKAKDATAAQGYFRRYPQIPLTIASMLLSGTLVRHFELVKLVSHTAKKIDVSVEIASKPRYESERQSTSHRRSVVSTGVRPRDVSRVHTNVVESVALVTLRESIS